MIRNNHGHKLTSERLRAIHHTTASSRIKDKRDDPINASRLGWEHAGQSSLCHHCGGGREVGCTVDDLDAWMVVLTRGANVKETMRLVQEAGAIDAEGR